MRHTVPRAEPQTQSVEGAWRVVLEGLEQDAYAGAVALVVRRGEVVLWRAAGWSVREPEPDQVAMALDTIFDLASLTKVVATLPSVLILIGRGELGLDQPVGEVLPEFRSEGAKRDITIRRLLSHSSGLPAWLPLYLQAHGPDGYLAAIAGTELAAEPGAQVIYSDLNFILLGECVRRLSGRDIARFAREEVYLPLGMGDTGFLPPAELYPRVAATERGNPYERGMAGEAGESFGRWRVEPIRGEVHDGNAFYGLDGVAGHAGLFGTAADLARYGQLWLDGGRRQGRQILPTDLVAEAQRPQSPGRGLGWALAPDEPAALARFAGRGLSRRAFGHTGFTGTSLWLDPARELVAILLTNRVHPHVRDAILDIRPRFHERLAAALPEEAGR